MTVCVAAICRDGTSSIVGASDRMLTAGDIQFQPPEQKVFTFTTSIVAMIAGDSAFQREILLEVEGVVQARVEAEPQNWWLVREIAELYRIAYNTARRRRSGQAILEPLGLNHESFVSRQAELAPTLASQLATELINFRGPDVATIVTGIDPTGAHIYVVNGGDVSCHDPVGFAAIGTGAWHAESQFMFAGHSSAKLIPETLLLAYFAKKRAEVAPGVGSETDMFLVGPSLGSYVTVGDHVHVELETIYQQVTRASERSARKANERMQQYVDEIAAASARAATQGQAAPEPDDVGRASTDEARAGAAPN